MHVTKPSSVYNVAPSMTSRSHSRAANDFRPADGDDTCVSTAGAADDDVDAVPSSATLRVSTSERTQRDNDGGRQEHTEKDTETFGQTQSSKEGQIYIERKRNREGQRDRERHICREIER